MGEDVIEGQALLEARRAQKRGAWEEARRNFARVLAQAPAHAESLHVLGVLDYQAGLLEDARDKLERAALARPDSPSILNNLGTVYLALNRLGDCLRVYTRAVELEPENAAYTANLVVALRRSGQHAPAEALARRLAGSPSVPVPPAASPPPSAPVVAPSPMTPVSVASVATAPISAPLSVKSPEARFTQALALEDRGQTEDALAHVERAIETHRSAPPDYLIARARMLMTLGRVEEATRAYTAVLAVVPDSPEAHMGLGDCLLLQGRLSDGVAHKEWRLNTLSANESLAPRAMGSLPMWDGVPDLGKTVLLHAEGEPGDVIRMVRLVRAVHAMVRKVVLEVPRPLVRLCQDSFRGLSVVARGEGGSGVPSGVDAHAPLMSLVHLLRLRGDDLPASPVPYLKAQPERVALWAERMGRRPGRKIGLVWEGNPHAPHDRATAIPLESLTPLLRVPGARFIVLQKGESESMRSLSPDLRGRLETLGLDYESAAGESAYTDTLAVLMSCDLVITSDCAVAHLAGALGRPCFVMLKRVPNSFWGIEGQTSAWYPTSRLFRQPTPESGRTTGWERVGEAVAEAVSQHFAHLP